MGAEPKNFKELVDALYKWTIDRLERTPFLSFKFTFPRQYISPFGYLGTLTAIVFAFLGLTGAFLMFYYRPDVELAYLSVKEIETEVPFGFLMRNLHYHASNFMILLAICHLYYQFFSGRYKIKNEILWVTGIILGILTVLEAYTGYDLILNQRAMLAINIGMGLTDAAPVLGPSIAPILIGGGFFDLVVRFYALHVFILPMLMLIIALIHFPRFLVIDLPVVLSILGVIFLAGGMFPVELGLQFNPRAAAIEVPEWYLTAIYAFIRTGTERFFSGALLPLLFAIMFLIVPFVDRSRRLSWRDRPFFTGLGIASILLILVTTVWGFYVDFSAPTPFEQLYVEPTIFYAVLALLTMLGFFVSYRFLTRPRPRRRAPTKPVVLSMRQSNALMLILLVLVIFAGVASYQTYLMDLPNISMFNLGVLLILFSLLLHLYRHSLSQIEKTAASQAPRPSAPG